MTEPTAPEPAAPDLAATEHQHLDLDGLADVVAGERAAPTCATCAAAVVELEQVSLAVSARLGALPSAAIPHDVAERLDVALRQAATEAAEAADSDDAATAGASVTTLPSREAGPTPRRWLPAAAAAVILVGGVGLGVSTLGGSGSDNADTTASGARDSAAGGLAGLVRNDSGRNYDKASLPGLVPGILAGKATAPVEVSAPVVGSDGKAESSGGATDGRTGTGGTGQAPAASVQPLSAGPEPDALDELARLRTTEGLAACLAALLPPDDESVQPLALDYARFDGEAALLVVLPVPNREDKVDVFVVGADCAPADEDLLFFSRVDRPAR